MLKRQIVAMGGGGFSMEPDNTRLDDFILGLSGRDRPRLCFLPTPAKDDEGFIESFTDVFASRCVVTAMRLVDPDRRSPPGLLAQQDIVYVPGGDTVTALRVWRSTGVDQLLRNAWEHGTILCGLSAGSMCWFESGVTDSATPDGTLSPLLDGLGILPGSHCPHYQANGRRETYRSLVGTGTLPPGIAAEDFAALHFIDTELVDVIASRAGAMAYRVERVAGTASEQPLVPRVLA